MPRWSVSVAIIVLLVATAMGNAVTESYAYSSVVTTTGTISQSYSSLTVNGSGFNPNSVITIGKCVYTKISDEDTDAGYDFGALPQISSGYYVNVSSPYQYRLAIEVEGADGSIAGLEYLRFEFYDAAIIDEDDPNNNVPEKLRDTLVVPLTSENGTRQGSVKGTAVFEPDTPYPMRVYMPPMVTDQSTISLGVLRIIAVPVIYVDESMSGTSWAFGSNILSLEMKNITIETQANAVEALQEVNDGNATNNRDDNKVYEFRPTTESGQPAAIISSSPNNDNVSSNLSAYNVDFVVPAGQKFCVKVVYNQGFIGLPNTMSVKIGDYDAIPLNSGVFLSNHTAYIYHNADKTTLKSDYSDIPGKVKNTSDLWLSSGGSGIPIHIEGFKGGALGGGGSLTFTVIFQKTSQQT